MKPSMPTILLLSLCLHLGCRGGQAGAGLAVDDDDASADSGDTDADADFPPALLSCPTPGSLPFSTQSTGFASDEARDVAESLPRFKDQGSDILGNPGGLSAYTSMPLSQGPGDSFVFAGQKARTAMDRGLEASPLAGEWVSLWGYDGDAWSELAREQTDENGGYRVSGIVPSPNPFQPIYSVLEADGSCAPHYGFLLPPGTQVVVTDIDGTLTIADEELFKEIEDGAYDPVENASASRMMNVWHDKGYVIVYLTARPHAFRAETRAWLDRHDYPPGPVISANSLVFGESARQYKRTWCNRVMEDLRWDVVAAYGNETSDIDAYEDSGISKSITFIVGPHAGVADTVAILDNDFSAHISDFVQQQPDATEP
jgi:hypothetical protein